MTSEKSIEDTAKKEKKPGKWLRAMLWVMLTPIALFILLMVLLYIPPVQNLLRKQATTLASEATGMHITVERIGLRFPLNLLVQGVRVLLPADSLHTGDIHPDTLLNLNSLDVRIQAWPLLQGKVEINNITLTDVTVNSSDLLEGMRIKGHLGRFFLRSHGIDLPAEEVILNDVELENSQVERE